MLSVATGAETLQTYVLILSNDLLDSKKGMGQNYWRRVYCAMAQHLWDSAYSEWRGALIRKHHQINTWPLKRLSPPQENFQSDRL